MNIRLTRVAGFINFKCCCCSQVSCNQRLELLPLSFDLHHLSSILQLLGAFWQTCYMCWFRRQKNHHIFSTRCLRAQNKWHKLQETVSCNFLQTSGKNPTPRQRSIQQETKISRNRQETTNYFWFVPFSMCGPFRLATSRFRRSDLRRSCVSVRLSINRSHQKPYTSRSFRGFGACCKGWAQAGARFLTEKRP